LFGDVLFDYLSVCASLMMSIKRLWRCRSANY